jgi:hypothetical protein
VHAGEGAVAGLAMIESQNPWVETKKTGWVSAAGSAVQSAAVGQSGLGAAQIGLRPVRAKPGPAESGAER